MHGHAATQRTVQRGHVAQVDVLRVVTMFAVIGVHTVLFTPPAGGIGSHDLLVASAAVQGAWTAGMQYAWAWLPGPVQSLFQSAQVGLWSYQFFVLVGALAAVHASEVREWIREHTRLALGLALGALAAGEGV